MVLAALSILLLLFSVMAYQHDTSEREKARKFMRDYSVEERHPGESEIIDDAPSADIAYQAAALVALDDALGTVPLEALSPRLRSLWLQAVRRLPAELEDARALELQAAAIRPGWPYHLYLAGKLTYARERQSSDVFRAAEQWLVPLRLAASRAPGDDGLWNTLAGATLESWPFLPQTTRTASLPVIRRAFFNPAFAARAFAATTEALGAAGAAALVPDEPGSLDAAFQTFMSRNDLDTAWALRQRWRQAEWRSRKRDLERVEERARLQDSTGLPAAARQWFARHSLWNFDDGQGRAQVARLLELWPVDQGGRWETDPRGEMVRYFLAGRETSVDGGALLRATSVLSDVPDPVAASCRLLGGDVYGSERMLVTAVSSGAFEWTPFILRLVQRRLADRQVEEARRAFEYLAPAAAKGCDVLIVESALLRAEGRSSAEADRSLAMLENSTFEDSNWSADGRLSVCIDPTAQTQGLLRLHFADKVSAIVYVGWDDGGTRTVRIGNDSATGTELSLKGLSGRHVLSVRNLGPGPAVIPTLATREP